MNSKKPRDPPRSAGAALRLFSGTLQDFGDSAAAGESMETHLKFKKKPRGRASKKPLHPFVPFSPVPFLCAAKPRPPANVVIISAAQSKKRAEHYEKSEIRAASVRYLMIDDL